MIDILKAKERSPLHDALLNHVRGKLKASRGHMQKYYAQWDAQHEVYMHRRPADKNDADAIKQGLPDKLVVPISSAEMQTGVAFGFMLYTQRSKFYEFDPTEDADRPARAAGETLIHRDMLASGYKERLVRTLVDVMRFGMGVEKDCWATEYAYVPIASSTTPSYNGTATGDAQVVTKVEKVVRREGNVIRSVSPYRTFLDPGFHVTDWRRGDFVATDEEYTKNVLLGMQSEGVVVGVEHIQKYTSSTVGMYNRKDARWSGIDPSNPSKSEVVCVTECIIKLVPAEVKTPTGEALGPETVPHFWMVWMANDDRIIRAEPLNYLHAQFPLSVGFFLPDSNDCVALNSLAYTMGDLQKLVSWFMNSRMAAVTRTVDNQLVVDPGGVMIEDIVARHRLVRLQKAAAGKDARRYVMPLPITDSTTGHVTDMQNVISLIQLVTGVNDNMMGQYNGGRRSATEARSTITGASSRMKMVFDVLWEQMYQTQANRLLINSRQGISEEEFTAVIGDASQYAAYKSEPRRLVRSYDYTPYDGTLPSEKIFIAQQLMELVSLIMANPVAAAAFNLDPNKILKEATELKGLGTLRNFGYDQVPQNLIASLQMLHGPTGQSTAQPSSPAA